jgi:hypothetical protein
VNASDVDPSAARTSSVRRLARSPAFHLAVVVIAGTLLFQGGDIDWSDGTSMYQVSRSLVEDGDVAIVQGVVWEGRDGRYYSPFGIGLSLVAVPVYAAVRLARVVVGIPEYAAQGIVSLLMPLIAAAIALAVFSLARRLGGGQRSSAILALGVVGGTFLLIYTKTFSSEPLAALLFVVAVERTLARRPWTAGAAAAGAALARPQFFVLSLVYVWGSWRESGWRGAVRAAVPIAVATVVQLVYNVARWGDALNFGYTNTAVPQGFTTPLLTGLRSLVLNPEKSIVLFAPIVIVAPFALARLWRRQRTAFWLISVTVAVTLVLSATWWDWGGGFTWGPRLLLPALPLLVAPIAAWVDERRRRAVAAATLLILGAIVSLPSLLVGGGAQLEDRSPPEQGPRILRQYTLLPSTISYTVEHVYREPAGREPARVLYLWQAGLTYRAGRLGMAVSIAGSMLLAGVAFIEGRRLFSAVAEDVAPGEVDPDPLAALS